MLRGDGFSILRSALEAVSPETAIQNSVSFYPHSGKLIIFGEEMDIRSFRKIHLIAVGKAAPRMADALENILGNYLTDGLVVTKYGHAIPLKKCRIMEAGHPIPDEKSLEAGNQIREYFQTATCKDHLILFLLSGGASSLLCSPAEGISLEEIRAMNQALLSCGADIHEVNTIRRQVSAIKGGKLLADKGGAAVVTLAISDVVGDRPESIGSGPTVPDPTTFADAMEIISKYSLADMLPDSMIRHIGQGYQRENNNLGKIASPPESLHFHIILNNETGLRAAKLAAENLGYSTRILSTRQTGILADCAATFHKSIRNAEPGKICLLSGGECTVKLPPNPGKGGRNQYFTWEMRGLLAEYLRPFWFASIGTDGTDGPTDAAGAWLDRQILRDYENIRREERYSPRVINQTMNFYPLWDRLGNLIRTGPTGTNVMDVQIFLSDFRTDDISGK